MTSFDKQRRKDMETITVFQEQQAKTIKTLEQILVFLHNGKLLGVNIDQNLIEKIEHGIKETSTEKLKVALIGGVSEGKTSIAAAWLERYDTETMKVSQAESSDEVVVYSLDDIELIDTPGLFGLKETVNQKKYKDITKEYISTAHLALYVMNPNNPIKESHKEELLWLFKDLQLLPRTVFVLSRFDEEVDIESNDDYSRGLKIKKDNIVERLRYFGVVGVNDILKIVAVSANPFNMGISHWLEHLQEFKSLSRIDTLQVATTEKIQETGSRTAIVVAAQKSIVSDVLLREMPIAESYYNNVAEECRRFSEVCADMLKELNQTERKISDKRITLRDFIMKLFTDYILQAQGTGIETFNDFFQRNIGDEGIVLDSKIINEFERQLGSAYSEIDKIQLSLNAGVEHYKNVMGDIALKGLKFGGEFLKGGALKFTNTGILAIRDVLMPAIKFKPWGAVKLAANLNKAMPIIGSVIGIGMEAWDSYSEAKKKQEFERGISEMVVKFEQQRKEYYEMLNNDQVFIQQFFPNYIELRNEIGSMEAKMSEKKRQQEQFARWRQEGEAIVEKFQIMLSN